MLIIHLEIPQVSLIIAIVSLLLMHLSILVTDRYLFHHIQFGILIADNDGYVSWELAWNWLLVFNGSCMISEIVLCILFINQQDGPIWIFFDPLFKGKLILIVVKN